MLMKISGCTLSCRGSISRPWDYVPEGDRVCLTVELDVSGNRIADLTPVSALGASLERLDASKNSVREIPQAFRQLGSMTHLRLEGNNISSMDGIRVLSDIPKLRNLYFQNKKESNNGDEGKSDEKHDSDCRNGNPVCNHPAYTTTLLRYSPDLVVLDGERIKLRESSQNAMLAAMAVPAEKLEIPEQSRWLEGFHGRRTKAHQP